MVLLVGDGAMPDPGSHPKLPESDSLWELMRRCWTSEPAERPSMSQIIQEVSDTGG